VGTNVIIECEFLSKSAHRTNSGRVASISSRCFSTDWPPTTHIIDGPVGWCDGAFNAKAVCKYVSGVHVCYRCASMLAVCKVQSFMNVGNMHGK
jgi:hypothetical protein